MRSSSDRRVKSRKSTMCIEVNDLTSVGSFQVIAKKGHIVNASTSGFLLELSRPNLVPEEFRENLSLAPIIGQHVCLYMPHMNLDLDGTVTRAQHVGKGKFVVAIDFSFDVPDYWRECLVDLLPEPGELAELSEEEE